MSNLNFTLREDVAKDVRDNIERKNKPIDLNNMTLVDYCSLVSSTYSPQRYGSLMEKAITDRFCFTKVSSKEDCGDYKCQENKFVELKCSVVNSITDRKFNVVQIRPWQNVDHYQILVLDNTSQNVMAYKLSKEQMLEEAGKHGSVAHGTKSASDENTNIEYRLSITLESKHHKRWNNMYFDDEFAKKFITL